MPTMIVDYDDDTQDRPRRTMGSSDEKVATTLLDDSACLNEF
jgi:hypothetical protein